MSSQPTKSYRALIALIAVLGGCAHAPPRDCNEKSAYPVPPSVCKNVDSSLATGSVGPSGSLDMAPGLSSPKSSKKLTLSQLTMALVESNPDIGMAGSREKEIFASIRTAQAAGKPTLDGSISAGPQQLVLPAPVDTTLRRDASITLKQTLYDFGATKNDVKRAESSYDSATSMRIAKTEEAALNMMEAFLKVKQNDEMMAVTRDNIAAHQKILDLVQLSAEGGNSTVADIKRITTRLENAKTSLVDLKTARTNAADKFRYVAGLEVDNVDSSGYEKLDGKVNTLDNATLETNPAIISIQHEIEALRYQLAATKAQKLPVFGLQGTVKGAQNMNDSSPHDNEFSAYVLATVKVPLYDGGLNDSQQDQIRSRIDNAMYKLERQRRTLQEEARSASRAMTADSDKSDSLATRVDAARKVAELYLEQFKSGGRSIFELLDGQAEYFKARSDLIEQKFTRRRAQISALQLRGELVSSLLAINGMRPVPKPVYADTMATGSIASKPKAVSSAPALQPLPPAATPKASAKTNQPTVTTTSAQTAKPTSVVSASPAPSTGPIITRTTPFAPTHEAIGLPGVKLIQ